MKTLRVAVDMAERRGESMVYLPAWHLDVIATAFEDATEALAFARSVILSGEPWSDECERIIGGALAKARGES